MEGCQKNLIPLILGIQNENGMSTLYSHLTVGSSFLWNEPAVLFEQIRVSHGDGGGRGWRGEGLDEVHMEFNVHSSFCWEYGVLQ